jgi:hypothetical protein
MPNVDTSGEAASNNQFDPLGYLKMMLPLLIRMLQAQGGQPIADGEGWKNDRQFLAKKFLYHLQTLLRTAEGAKIEHSQGEHSFIDHGTINVISRALLENFIVFEWVFGPSDESLSYFRYLTWVVAGLKERSDTPARSDIAKRQQALDWERCGKLCQEIKSNEHFKEISNGAQKALLLGKWRMGQSIEEIAVQVGFHSKQLDGLYSYLCSYSHSSYISALQIGQANEKMEKELSRMAIGVSCNMTARMIETYARLFPVAQQVLAGTSEDEKRAVGRWNFLREDFESSYGPDTVKAPRAWKDGRPVSGDERPASPSSPS